MRDELHRWLDGEIGYEDLPAELRAEADRWRAVLDARREVGSAPPWLSQRVMHGLPAARPTLPRRLAAWVTRPRTVQVRPLTIGAVALTAALALLLVPAPPPQTVPAAPEVGLRSSGDRDADGRVYVQFMYVAPEAGAVAVAGDFNDWSAHDNPLEDPDGDGIWTGRLPIAPGLHKYMFVVDGEWMTDPQADRYVDDGFGNRNALMEVAGNGSAI